MRILRSLSFGIGLAALSLAAGFAAPATAATATLRGEAMRAGFGRIAFAFDVPVTTRVRVANGVVVIGFSQPVQLDPSKLAAELPNYVSVIRVDPDGRGLRLALARASSTGSVSDENGISFLPHTPPTPEI